ncbi:MAG TPA: c-type cytochrome [Burkholderiales bacterium]
MLSVGCAVSFMALGAGDKPWSGLGRAATPREIAAWDIDVKPDGSGLPKGRGSVTQGQEIYDAKCASCHGTFGESNQYMQLAGGVGSLRGDNPVRTTGSKLNYAATLWDYINRAMPFQAPKSLTADEVYALTAYLLYLNEIVPEDATLDQTSILQVQMPNRDGFTTQHGFLRRDGKPDVQASACMRDCPIEGKVTSRIPDYARNAQGNLATQFRVVGPYRGADTSKPEPIGPLAAARQALAGQVAAAATPQQSAADLAKHYACIACHGIEQKIVGPGFKEVAQKYAGDATARQALMRKVRDGGAGVWGAIPMPGQPQVAEADLVAIIDWVLAGAK